MAGRIPSGVPLKLVRPVPLRALIEGRDVVAPLLDEVGWEALRRDVRAKRSDPSLPCCGASAFPRVSKLGTRHFVHRRARACPGSGETFQHLWAKAEILEACKSAGWQAQPEAAGGGWRADVIATRGSARVAFEVQWSAQDLDTFRLRQDRYASDGIRGCWLYRGEIRARDERSLPLFELKRSDERIAVIKLGGRDYGVREFVNLLLGGHIRFSSRLATRLRVSFVDYDCWRCGKRAHVYYAQQFNRCTRNCGLAFTDEIDTFDARVIALVRNWLAQEGRSAGIQLGAIKRRYSRTVESSYLSFGCPHCDALFGDWFIRQVLWDAIYDEYAAATLEVDAVPIGLRAERGHWCHDAADAAPIERAA